MNDRDIKGISRIIVHIENIVEYMKPIRSLNDFNIQENIQENILR
jgi:hypothetical protein